MSNVKFRYGTDLLTLSGNLGPTYPNNEGTQFYSEPLEHPEYITTQRDYPDTKLMWQSSGISSPADVWTFWNTTLSRGKEDFTIIDHDYRLLFDVSWPQWKKRWNRNRGGSHDIVYELYSAFDWTPPMFGFFPSTGDALVSHTLDGAYLLLDAGTMVDNATDSNVLRKTGYALRIGNGSTNAGASDNTLSWKRSKDNGSLSLFAQVRLDDMVSVTEALVLIGISRGSNDINLMADWSGDGLGWHLSFNVDSEEIEGTVYLLENTWYDVCGTIDPVNGNMYVYWVPSAANDVAWGRSHDFLYGKTDIATGIKSSTITTIPNVIWDTCTLMKPTGTNIFSTASDYGYLQNIMIMDEFISPLEFNKLRRLCHMWNKKTTGSWPK